MNRKTEKNIFVSAVDNNLLKTTGIHSAYEKYCGSLTLEDIFTSDHVAICARRCASGFMDKKDTRRFMKACSYNSRLLARKVLSGKYKPKYYPAHTILERGKSRLIRPPVFECKVVQKVICDYLIRPLLTPKMISTNYASVTGRGTDKMYADIEDTLNRLIRQGEPKVLVITDYSSYFASIPHEPLQAVFSRYIFDPRIVCLIMLFCQNDEGLSLGNELSQVPASFYPSPIDHFVKDDLRIPYFRYMDDTLAAVSLEKTSAYIDSFRSKSKCLGLTLKPEKIRTYRLGEEFTFCKEHFYVSRRTGLYYRMVNAPRLNAEIKKIGKWRLAGISESDIASQFRGVYGSISHHPHTRTLSQKLIAACGDLSERRKTYMTSVISYIPAVEVRGCIKRTSRAGKAYLLVFFDFPDNQSGETSAIMDRHTDRMPLYTKGLSGSLALKLTFGRYDHIEIEEFIPDRKTEQKA